MSILKNINLEKLRKEAKSFNVAHRSRSYSHNGTRPEKPALIRVVVHSCGNRIELSNKMFEDMGKPNRVEIDYTDDYLVFRACEGGSYKISNPPKAKNPIIYCKALAETILEMYECSDSNQASHSFCEGGLVEDVFLVKVQKRAEATEEATDEESEISEAEIAETEENFEEEVLAESEEALELEPELEAFEEETFESEPSSEDLEDFEEEPDLFMDEE